MLNDIIIGKYYPVNSNIHNMNPISKIICTIIFIIMCFLANSVGLNIMLLLLTIIMILNANIPFKIFLDTIKSLRFILLIIIIINIVLRVSIDITIMLLLKIILIVIYTTILTLTTPPTEITYGLEKILLPLKLIGVNTKKLALFITKILRFIPILIDQKNKILKSISSRGLNYKKTNLKNKFIIIKSMFILSIDKTNKLVEMMYIRLYNIDKKRVNFRQNMWGVFDTYLCLMHLLFLALIIKKGVVV